MRRSQCGAWSVLTVCGVLASSCAGTPVERGQPAGMDGAAWRAARQELQRLRDDFSPEAGTLRVTVSFSVAGEGLQVRGRGAVSRRPPDDLRMILLGPGGMTAFDLLVRGEAWQLEMPGQDRTLRHDDEDLSDRGLPVSFLRWWLLRPLSGRLLSVADTDAGRVFVLRDEGATIRVRRQGAGLVMDRRSSSGLERMSVSRPGCARAVYEHVDDGVRADVRCESFSPRVAGLDEPLQSTPPKASPMNTR